MHLKRTIRRGLRRLVQLYADAARAHTGCVGENGERL